MHALIVTGVFGNDYVGTLIEARKKRDIAVIPVVFFKRQALKEPSRDQLSQTCIVKAAGQILAQIALDALVYQLHGVFVQAAFARDADDAPGIFKGLVHRRGERGPAQIIVAVHKHDIVRAGALQPLVAHGRNSAGCLRIVLFENDRNILKSLGRYTVQAFLQIAVPVVQTGNDNVKCHGFTFLPGVLFYHFFVHIADLVDLAVGDKMPVIENDGAVADPPDLIARMRNEQYRNALFHHALEFFLALFLKL